MDYGKIYADLIQRGLDRTLGDGVYFEKHHVWPKCMGGPDEESNLVKLTAEEHFLAHQLLVKMFPDNGNLVFAANMMCKNSSGNRLNNKMYGWLKKKHSLFIKKIRTGKKHSEETRLKISEKAKLRKHSEETRQKMSESLKGRAGTFNGKKHSEETRRNISESRKAYWEAKKLTSTL